MIDETVDVVVICATKEEFEEVERASADAGISRHEKLVWGRTCVIQEIAGPRARLTFALISSDEIGRVPAALVARDIIYHFMPPPRYVILCGIAAADPQSGYQLGDVVIPQYIVDYAEQKHSSGTFKLRVRTFNLLGRLHGLAQRVGEIDWFQYVPNETIRVCKQINKSIRTPPMCHHHLGLACGDYVLDDKALVEDILGRLSENQKHPVKAVEMESTGIARALETSDGKGPQFIVVKAISDFAYGKDDSAQPYARATAAYFLKSLLLRLAETESLVPGAAPALASVPRLVLGPSENVKAMLCHFPPAVATEWQHRAIDGAIEILRCTKPTNAYGGFKSDEIFCNVDNGFEWPDDIGGLTPDQRASLTVGLVGQSDPEVPGWLAERGGSPGRIRVLTAPPSPPVLDRPTLSLNFGNSDYFTVRTITELSRLDRSAGSMLLAKTFPERWAPPQRQFPSACIPYHVSVQAVITCRTPDHARYLLLASASTLNPTITTGWGATMAEQMWAPDRPSRSEPWWREPAASHIAKFQPAETRAGDLDIGETLARGLREEFDIDTTRDLTNPPLLLSAAIEEDMYFVTFIYVVTVNATLERIYQKWDSAPDRNEMGRLAAYQYTGRDAAGARTERTRSSR